MEVDENIRTRIEDKQTTHHRDIKEELLFVYKRLISLGNLLGQKKDWNVLCRSSNFSIFKHFFIDNNRKVLTFGAGGGFS